MTARLVMLGAATFILAVLPCPALLAPAVPAPAVPAPALPAPADSEPDRPLDERLLEDLNADPLDEFDRELFAPESKKPPGAESDAPEATSPGEETDALDRQLLRELGAAAASEDENPLLGIAQNMRDVEGLIGRTQSGPKTQDLQDRIVADLGELLKQARSRCRQCNPAQGNPSQANSRRPVTQPKQPGTAKKPGNNPARDSNATPGSAEQRQADIDQIRDILKQLWGDLPQRERERMREPRVEEFLPKYQQLIEEYFKRLAEEQGTN